MAEEESKIDPLEYNYAKVTYADLDWKPEDYGFVQIKGEGLELKAVWKKGKFRVISLSPTLWVCKKEIYTPKEGTEGVEEYDFKRVLKWHMTIDCKELADLYFTKGLRG